MVLSTVCRRFWSKHLTHLSEADSFGEENVRECSNEESLRSRDCQLPPGRRKLPVSPHDIVGHEKYGHNSEVDLQHNTGRMNTVDTCDGNLRDNDAGWREARVPLWLSQI